MDKHNKVYCIIRNEIISANFIEHDKITNSYLLYTNKYNSRGLFKNYDDEIIVDNVILRNIKIFPMIIKNVSENINILKENISNMIATRLLKDI